MAKLNCSVCGYGMAMGVTTCAHCRKISKKLAEISRRDLESA